MASDHWHQQFAQAANLTFTRPRLDTRRSHSGSINTPYICQQCGVEFSDSVSLSSHVNASSSHVSQPSFTQNGAAPSRFGNLHVADLVHSSSGRPQLGALSTNVVRDTQPHISFVSSRTANRPTTKLKVDEPLTDSQSALKPRNSLRSLKDGIVRVQSRSERLDRGDQLSHPAAPGDSSLINVCDELRPAAVAVLQIYSLHGKVRCHKNKSKFICKKSLSAVLLINARLTENDDIIALNGGRCITDLMTVVGGVKKLMIKLSTSNLFSDVLQQESIVGSIKDVLRQFDNILSAVRIHFPLSTDQQSKFDQARLADVEDLKRTITVMGTNDRTILNQLKIMPNQLDEAVLAMHKVSLL